MTSQGENTEGADDPFDLQRFVGAQDKVMPRVLRELAAGHKQSHWMWYVFPQIRGLGFSDFAVHFGIRSRAEAQAYLGHPVLGARLLECVRLLLAVHGRTLHEILGSPDDLKFRSSMTLFDAVAPERAEFRLALDRFCNGEPDPRTQRMLARQEQSGNG